MRSTLPNVNSISFLAVRAPVAAISFTTEANLTNVIGALSLILWHVERRARSILHNGASAVGAPGGPPHPTLRLNSTAANGNVLQLRPTADGAYGGSTWFGDDSDRAMLLLPLMAVR